MVWDGEIAFKNDGTLLGVKATVIHDLGVESTNKGIAATSIFPACSALANAYHWRGMHVEGLGIVTNKSFYCAYRGYGKDKGVKFIEHVLDQVAKELHMTPEALRFMWRKLRTEITQNPNILISREPLTERYELIRLRKPLPERDDTL